MTRGGVRKGAGRPKKQPTQVIRVPKSFVLKIKEFINNLLKNERDNQKVS